MKLTVEIVATHGCSVVAHNYAVWVSHRDHFKDYSLSEIYCVRLIRRYEIQETLHYKGCISFSRVHSAANYYVLLIFVQGRRRIRSKLSFIYNLECSTVHSA